MALDCTAEGNAESPEAYDIASVHTDNYNAGIDSETDDKNYYYEGKISKKTSSQRTFQVTGDRIIGDAFQDFVCSHAVKFGKGSAVLRGYVYFCVLTGKGEKGLATIVVNNDGNGESGASGEIDVEIKSQGEPEEYTYSASV